MQFSGIYAITDDLLLPGERLFTATEEALRAGIQLLQYRSKSDSADFKFDCAIKLLALCDEYRIPLVINDGVELCEKINAAGVHLGTMDEDIQSARTILGPNAIIGISCHSSIDEALKAEQLGASYVAFGRFFPSKTKPEAPAAELQLIAEARQVLSIPIVAIGGINAENGAAVFQAGADMLAVIHAIFGGDDVTATTLDLLKLCDKREIM
jgi:thiamine-phosphate pyrophosphorylase